MTKKVPRRWSKRVVIYDASDEAASTRDAADSGGAAEGELQRLGAEAPDVASPASEVLATGGSGRGPELTGASPTVASRRRRIVSLGAGQSAAPSGGFAPEHSAVTSRAARENQRAASRSAAPTSQGASASESVSASPAAARSSLAMSSAAVARAPLEAPVPAARALVVDDDPEIRRALARLLRPELDVHLAGSVAQAEALLEQLDRVDVAFIDWELPDGTGEQILERLAHWPDAIRVLISAKVSSSENPLKNRALANLVLGKPLALGVIEALKRAALAHD